MKLAHLFVKVQKLEVPRSLSDQQASQTTSGGDTPLINSALRKPLKGFGVAEQTRLNEEELIEKKASGMWRAEFPSTTQWNGDCKGDDRSLFTLAGMLSEQGSDDE